jgi:hypothetical protein
MRHFPFRELGYAIGFLVFLAALYVGAYCAMVEKVELFAPTDPGGGMAMPRRVIWATPRYRIDDAWGRRIYAPIHAADRQLRPHFWNAPSLLSD